MPCLFNYPSDEANSHMTQVNDGATVVFLRSTVFQSSAELILNQEQEMWSGALADPQHCLYCQSTAVAHVGEARGTFKGYLSWEKIKIHSHTTGLEHRQNGEVMMACTLGFVTFVNMKKQLMEGTI